MLGQDPQTIDSLMLDFQNDVASMLYDIAEVVAQFDDAQPDSSTDKRLHDDCLQQLQVAALATDNFDNFLREIKLVQSYIAGTDENLLVKYYKACCSNAMLGGEAALMASNYLNVITVYLDNAYLAADLILGANAYVCHNKADYNKLKSTDPDFASYNPNTFANEKYFTDSINELMADYEALFGKNHTTDDDNVILRGAIGRYNRMVRDVWFYYIADCDYTASPQ